MTSNEELCCLVSLAKWNESDRKHAQEIARHADDAFWELAKFNGISVLAAKRCEELGVVVPKAIRESVAHIRESNFHRRQSFLLLAHVLCSENIEVYVLKGFLLGEIIYNDPAYKRMNDIDILLKPDCVHKAIQVAGDNGFRFATTAMIGSDPIDFRLHHSPPLVSSDYKTVLGVHWNIASPFAKRKPRSDIFEGAQGFEVEGVRLHRLSHEHNILHMCMHLPFFKTGLRELADVANLMRHERISVESLIETAKSWRCEDALYRVLSLANCAIPCLRESQSLTLQSLGRGLPKSRYVSDTAVRVADRSLLLRSRSVYVGRVEKNYALFKLATRFSDRCFYLKEQWRLVLCVPSSERARLLPKKHWFVRTRATTALLFAMMQDLGPWLLFAVTVKNVLSLFRAKKGSEQEFEVAKQMLATME